jgi:hypothetical protein
MLYIAKFAKELGVDTIACNKLRADKFSPIKKILENMPEYHLTEKGEVYSDKYSHADLKRINKKIKYSFYTPFKAACILNKFLRANFFRLKDLISISKTTPFILKKIIAREQQKAALRRA